MAKHIENQVSLFGSPVERPIGDSVGELVRRLQHTQVAYIGELPLDFITPNAELSRTNWMTRKKIKAVMGVTGFVKPLVLDSEFRIIDGELRFEVLRELQAEGHYTKLTVPVVVYIVDSTQAAFLRIALNRMGEFARWDFKANPEDAKRKVEDIPEFLDSAPALQKLLEPFGFWADKLLPDDFYRDTILEFEKKQPFPLYTPEIGLVRWAAIQAERNAAKLAEERKSPLKSPGVYVPIVNLKVTEEDYTPTYPINDEVEEYTLHMRDVAGIITDAYDVKRRAEKDAKGQDWQTKRRAPKKVILDKKAEAIARASDLLDDSFDDSLGEDSTLADDEVNADEAGSPVEED